MSGYILKGLKCTAEGCSATTTYRTPQGQVDKRDEQGRCPRCSTKNLPVRAR